MYIHSYINIPIIAIPTNRARKAITTKPWNVTAIMYTAYTNVRTPNATSAIDPE